MSFDIAKAGWVHRLTSILRNWKRAWFVLYTDGTLRYFESPDKHTAEDAVSIPVSCRYIKVGSEVQELTPPAGRDRNCLLEITFRDKTWNLCAESEDDARAWYYALQDAKTLRPPRPVRPTYRVRHYPRVTYAYPDQYVHVIEQPADAPPGQTVVIIDDRRDDYLPEYGSGLLMGAFLGSMMFYPLLWC